MLEWIFRWGRDLCSLGLWEVLQRRGLRRAADADPQALARAVERCTVCRSSSRCAHVLDACQDEKLDTFCPNVMYLSHLQAMERHAPKKDLL